MASYNARMNPLYAGPPVADGHAAPVNAPRGSSDEDPKSGPTGYIPPALYQDDEEPQDAYSQHYYVQTPNGKYTAPSHEGDEFLIRPGSPLSSVTQSESHLSAAGQAPLDARPASSLRQIPKQRSVNVYLGEYPGGYPPAYAAGYPMGHPSGYQAGYSSEYAAAVPGRVTGDMAGLDEAAHGDKVPLCKSVEMSAKVALQRKKNGWMMCLVITMFVVVLVIAGGSIFAYKTFQPAPPIITFEVRGGMKSQRYGESTLAHAHMGPRDTEKEPPRDTW